MLITKQIFLASLKCPTQAWLALRDSAQEDEAAAEDELLILEGKEVGERARGVFSGGKLVPLLSNEQSAQQTAKFLQDPEVTSIFEATFIHGDFIAKADVLVREKGGWKLIEVKSSLHNDESVEEQHQFDLAYTAFVARGAGLKISSIEIMRLSRDWRLGSPPEALFRKKECAREVLLLAAAFEGDARAISASIRGAAKPSPVLITTCKKCGYFSNECHGKDVGHSVLEIPNLHEKKLNLLAEAGTIDIKKLPAKFPLTDNQEKVVRSAQSGKEFLDRSALKDLLGKIKWPCYYLDFETIKSAVPFWPDIAPHEQILTQYSLHLCRDQSAKPTHVAYLASHESDCRRELAEKLVADLGQAGSIVVYSSFEKTQLGNLAKQFPNLAPALESCISRLFDLEKVFKEVYYHPDFRGKSSIKKTLPVLIPALSYKGLAISNGSAAIAAFIGMARGRVRGFELEKAKKDLLEYCAMDTMAMVELHRWIVAKSAPARSR